MAGQAQDEVEEVEVKTPAGSIRARGTDIIAILALIGIALMAYALWDHKVDAKLNAEAFIGAIREMTVAQKDTTKMMRLQACIISQPQEKREAEFSSVNSFCNRMAAP